MVKFSIVVPIYNTADYLEYCLNSILKQTYKDFELILVNDGSTDNSREICLMFKEKDNRIKIIDKPNGGAGSARNVGLLHAAGDFIIFCDSDDYWSSSNFLQIVSDITFETNIDLIIFDYHKVYNENYRFLHTEKYNVISFNARNESLEYLIDKNKFTTSANWKVIKKDLLISNEILFPENTIAEDMDWGLNVYSKSQRIVYIDNKFYAYRQREGSITRSFNDEKISDLWNMIKKWIDQANVASPPLPKEVIWKYFSFHYFVLLALISRGVNSRLKIMKKVKPYNWLLDYIPQKKLNIFVKIRYLIGFKNYVKFSGFLFSIKRK